MLKGVLFKITNKIMGHFGVLVIPVRELANRSRLVNDFGLREHDILRLKESSSGGGLRQYLVENNKRRWLEIGCGGTLADDFYYIDIFPEGIVDRSFRDKYSRLDITNASAEELEKLGKFDLIRMQHVFE